VPAQRGRKLQQLLVAQRLRGIEIKVPADPSSAAFFVALASLASDGELTVTDVCLNPTRTGFLQAMKRMGGEVEQERVSSTAGEEVGTIRVRPARLKATRITSEHVPAIIDELPLIACVAAGAGIELEISGAAELRVKESDRITTVVQNLRAVGAEVDELPDGLRVRAGRKELAGMVDPRRDHRIAMAFAVAGMFADGETIVQDVECVRESYPGFEKTLDEFVSAKRIRATTPVISSLTPAKVDEEE